MLNTASMEEWLGTGSEESPIVIKGLSIMSNSCAIYISNVDLHFRIEECVITASESEITVVRFGIYILNCSQASIEKCIIWDQDTGICLWNSDGAYVHRTEIFDSITGIFVNESSSVWLHSLDVVVCKVGIRLNSSDHTYVDQTIIDHCEYVGIECFNDYGTMLRHNHIISSQLGVQMVDNENWALEETIIQSCHTGIDTIRSTGGYVLRSMIKNCSVSGVYLGSYSSNITCLENWFGPSNLQNAQDDGEANMWYEEYSQIGNYWSDYSGEGPYLIPGDAESLDLYPTSLEDAPRWEDVISIDGESTDDNGTTGNDTNLIDEPTLVIAITAAVIILLVVVAMVRSKVSPGI
ncbi:MAG: NosD domain-containing protein [Candidatus Thorarchaeota archaeon]